MAKRAPADEPEYNPLGASLVRDVIDTSTQERHALVTNLNTPSAGTAASLSERPARSEDLRSLPKAPHSVGTNHEKLSYVPPLRVLLPAREREELDQLVVSLATKLGTRVKLSHVIRSCLTLLRHSEEQLLKRAGRSQGLVRPTNHETFALAEFEDALTDLIEAAFHDTPPRRAGQVRASSVS
jgi:hypothetical protein